LVCSEPFIESYKDYVNVSVEFYYIRISK